MISFVIRRLINILVGLPIVVFFCLLVFQHSENDPVSLMLEEQSYDLSPSEIRAIYAEKSKALGTDLPLFYWSLHTSNYSQAYYTELLPQEREFYNRLLQGGASYASVQQCYTSLLSMKDNVAIYPELKNELLQFENLPVSRLAQLVSDLKQVSTKETLELEQAWNRIGQEKSTWKRLIPKFLWHGTQNLFHQKIKGLFRFDFGLSLSGTPAISRVSTPLKVTSFMVFCQSLIIFPIGIFLAMFFIRYDKTWYAKTIEFGLYILWAIPFFVLALFLLQVFATPDYGLQIFPSLRSIGFKDNEAILPQFAQNFKQLLLPILCLLLTNLAYISRFIKSIVVEEQKQGYVQTARMKGLNHKQVLKHQFRNGLPQIINLIILGIAFSFSGSLIVEYIFNIPGMGRLMIQAVQEADWNIILAVVCIQYLIIAALILLADYWIRRIDPRVKQRYDRE